MIPLLNRGEYISRSINSVLCQTLQPHEILVVDGGSSDAGPAIVKSYNNDKIKLVSQKGKGVSSARNEGVLQSSSEFFAFLDADDEWNPWHLEKLMALHRCFPKAGLYASAYEIVISGRHRRIEFYELPQFGIIKDYFRSAARGPSPIWTSVVGIEKRIFVETGGFPIHYQLGEDIDLWGRIALNHSIAYTSTIGGIYHQDSSNRLCNNNLTEVHQPFVSSASIAISNGKVPPQLIDSLKEYVSALEAATIYHNIMKKDKATAIKRLLCQNNHISLSDSIILFFLLLFPFSGTVKHKLYQSRERQTANNQSREFKRGRR